MKRKNAFTLIELLAIIVILAIIAVITVPIILGIIDDASKNAAKDSAYGYKDAVNKLYAQQLLINQNLELNDTYTVTNGTLSGGDFGDSNITSLPIEVSGKVPTSGTLTYKNNDLTSGCLVIGDYAVTFSGENVTSTTKGKCVPTMAEMCPDCKFIYYDTYNVVTSRLKIGQSLMPAEATTDYRSLISSHSIFLGLISNPNTNVIERAFACGVENGTPFCLEGYDTSKWENNLDILNIIYPSCNAPQSVSDARCTGSNVSANAFIYGLADVFVVGDILDTCSVNPQVTYCQNNYQL